MKNGSTRESSSVSLPTAPVHQYSRVTDKDVHKAPALELVGWFTVCAQDGPLLELVSLQKQITSLYNENAILLAFHPELVSSTHAVSGKLPITIYESVSEADPVKDDGSMQVDGEETWEIKFRPLPYTIETDETEMIAIDYVAKGAGSAAALVEAEPPAAPETTESTDKKGKKRADGPPEEQKQANGVEERVNPLTAEEEDQIAGITTRLNSVKMLQTRLALLSKFIHSLPPSYLSDLETALTPKSPDPSHLPHLRNIQALLTRLSLLTPAESASSPPPLVAALQAQSNDVALVSMLSLLGQDIQSLSELGRKFATVEGARSAKGKAKGGAFSGGTFAGLEERDARTAGFALSRGGGMLV